MSLEQAKEVLGFPPTYTPSPEEISKAYKTRAFQNHPDRGGDLDKMVAINVAKDILTGRAKAKWEPASPPPAPRRPVYKEPEPDETLTGQSFLEAWNGNATPPGVDWKFVSIPEYFYETSTHPGHTIWTMYGQTESKHIFCAIKRRAEGAGSTRMKDGRLVKIREDWQVSWLSVPISGKIGKIAVLNIKLVSKNWADGATPEAPKKFIAWSGDDKPTERYLKKVPRSGGAALKDILIGTGLLNEEEAAKSGRKSVVEAFFKLNLAKGKLRKWERVPNYDMFLRINGKEVQLEDQTTENLGRAFIPFVLGGRVSEGRPFNLSRLRGSGIAKVDAHAAMVILLEALTSEPAWVRVALEKAAQEFSVNQKTASLIQRVVERHA